MAYAPARVWWTGRRLADVAHTAQNFLRRSGNAVWGTSLPEELCRLPEVQAALDEIRGMVPGPSGCQAGFQGLPELLGSLQQVLAEGPVFELCASMWEVRPVLETQLRGAWYFTLAQGRSVVDLTETYEAMWTTLIRGFTRPDCERAAASASHLARSAGLEEVEAYGADPEAVFYYGLDNLLPHAPRSGELNGDGTWEPFLAQQLSRWYFRPFRRRLQPLDVVRGVLRAGRPLYYERILAHTLVEYFLVKQAWPEHRSSAAGDRLQTLASHLELLQIGYLLGRDWSGRLKQPSDWLGYLAVLTRLHCGATSADLDRWRRELIAPAGMRSLHDMLDEGTRGRIQ